MMSFPNFLIDDLFLPVVALVLLKDLSLVEEMANCCRKGCSQFSTTDNYFESTEIASSFFVLLLQAVQKSL